MSEQPSGQPNHTGEVSEDFQVEVSATDLHRSEGPADRTERGDGRHGNAAISPFAPRLTHRARAVRAGSSAGALLLALLVVLGGFPATRDAAGSWLARLHPMPVATAIPPAFYDHFYLLPNPPGTTVLLDGRALTSLPYPADPHPLGLSRGTHTFQWLNNAFPFPPLTCRLSVPAAPRDTCLVLTPHQVQPLPPPDGAVFSVPVIATHFTLNTLPTDQSNALYHAIASALNGLGTTVTLQPGEHYIAGTDAPPDTLSLPLRVTLTIHAVPQTLGGLCDLFAPAHPCYFLGQDCGALCTYVGASPGAPIVYNGIDPVWTAGMFVQMSLRNSTPDGRLIMSGILPSSAGYEIALLGILWDGANWHVLPLVGHWAPFPPSDDLVCDEAFETFAQSAISYLFYPTSAYDVTLTYASGRDPADGCAVRLVGNPHAAEPAIPGDGTALFLERLGVLLAASDAAHALWPDLPQANPAERAIAQRLAAQAG